MLKYILGLLSITAVFTKDNKISKDLVQLPGFVLSTNATNNCITFSLGPGTGCGWMCNYCENKLGTTNYYFTDGICTYYQGGCAGTPIAGVSYTCCAV